MPYKDLNKRREYHKNYMKMWTNKNKDRWKEIINKSNSRPERKEYLKKWWKESPKGIAIKNRFKNNHLKKAHEHSLPLSISCLHPEKPSCSAFLWLHFEQINSLEISS